MSLLKIARTFSSLVILMRVKNFVWYWIVYSTRLINYLKCPEMEFWDINFTKDSSIFAPCYPLSLLLADFKDSVRHRLRPEWDA
jgi:hypothetical protein